MHNAGLKFTKLLRIHITDMDPGTVHTRNPNLINERGSEQAGKPGHTYILSVNVTGFYQMFPKP